MKDKQLLPGDKGYLGGTTISTIYMNGKAKTLKVKKDSNGNITYTSITDKLFGLF